jgi:hypothetical protein
VRQLVEIQRRPMQATGHTMRLPLDVELLKIGEDGSLYLGKYEGSADEQETDWRSQALQFLSNLDPKEIDRLALDGLSMDDEGGAAAILRVLREMLGDTDG